jgi:Fe-S-cluster-containing hydrogenase component 2
LVHQRVPIRSNDDASRENSCKDEPDGPQCVKWCPEEALTFVTSDVLAQKARISAVKSLFQEAKEKKAEAK